MELSTFLSLAEAYSEIYEKAGPAHEKAVRDLKKDKGAKAHGFKYGNQQHAANHDKYDMQTNSGTPIDFRTRSELKRRSGNFPDLVVPRHNDDRNLRRIKDTGHKRNVDRFEKMDRLLKSARNK